MVMMIMVVMMMIMRIEGLYCTNKHLNMMKCALHNQCLLQPNFVVFVSLEHKEHILLPVDD